MAEEPTKVAMVEKKRVLGTHNYYWELTIGTTGYAVIVVVLVQKKK